MAIRRPGAARDGAADGVGIELPHRTAGESDLDMEMDMINYRGGWTALQVGGTWPGATFLTLVTGHYPPGDVYRWAGDRWARSKPGRARVLSWPRTVRAWKDRSGGVARALRARARPLAAVLGLPPGDPGGSNEDNLYFRLFERS